MEATNQILQIHPGHDIGIRVSTKQHEAVFSLHKYRVKYRLL